MIEESCIVKLQSFLLRRIGLHRLLLSLSFLAFISLGLPDGLLGVAWPSISEDFGVPLSRLAVLQIAMTVGFFFSSTNAGKLTRYLGVGKLLIFSNILIALALFSFVTAFHWYLVIAAAVFLGSGGGAIDAGLNAYSAEHFTKEHVTLLHAFYGFGAMLGPTIMQSVLKNHLPWQRGYLVTLILLLVLLALFVLLRHFWYIPVDRPSQAAEAARSGDKHAENAGDSGLWKPTGRMRGKKTMGMALFIFYTGLEVTIGAWSFSLLTRSRGIAPATAALWVGAYWAALTGGRLFFGFLGKRWTSTAIIRAMILGLTVGSLLLLQRWWAMAAMLALPIIGFSCAPLFPLFVTLTPHVVGKTEAPAVIGMQVASASLGAAIIPVLVGFAVETSSLEAVSFIALGLSIFVALSFRMWRPS